MDPVSLTAGIIATQHFLDQVRQVLGFQDIQSLVRDTYDELETVTEYMRSLGLLLGDLPGDLGVVFAEVQKSLADFGELSIQVSKRTRILGLPIDILLQATQTVLTGMGPLGEKAGRTLRDLHRWCGIFGINDVALAAEQVRDQIGRLYLMLIQHLHQNGNRANFIDEVRGSSQFRVLGEYDKAVVSALLARYQESSKVEEEAKYFTSSVRLVNRLGLKLASYPQIRGNQVNQAQEDIIREEADEIFLESISYRAMDHRDSGIEPASNTSVQRLFEEPRDDDHEWSTLTDWLTHGSGLYLIQGSEGSGKSTIMKHIYGHPGAKVCLNEWAGPSPLVMAAFYFWRSGTRLERSVEGLLRSLLHSVLGQQRRLIPFVFPMEWAGLYAAASTNMRPSTLELGSWKVDELRHAFLRLLEQDQIPMKFFFLIDGIDEYQSDGGDGGASMVIEFLNTAIGSSLRAKALVSSRPLDAFEDLGLQPQIKLDHLNRHDIDSYVRTSLNSDNKFIAAREADKDAADAMVANLLRTTGGTFLWAVICVNSIKADLARGKTLAEVSDGLGNEERPILQDLYRNIWSKMNDDARCRASRVAQIMIARTDVVRTMIGVTEGDTRLVDLALALDDPLATIGSAIRPWPRSAGTIQLGCGRLVSELTTTWPGFLTIAKPTHARNDWSPSSAIGYCHRSVPEFFRQESEMLTAAATWEVFQFCPYVALMKSAVQQLKFVPPTTPLRQLWAFATMALLAANSADPDQDPDQGLGSTYPALLDELDRTMQHCHDRLQRDSTGEYLEARIQDPNGIVGINDKGRNSKRIAKMHWSNFHFDSACSHRQKTQDSFLSLAVRFGLQNYVIAELRNNKPAGMKKALRPRKGRPLLDYALVPSSQAPYDLVKSTFIKALLDLGASPNDKFEKKTVWERALEWQYEAFVETQAHVVRETGDTSDDARRAAEDRLNMFKLLVEAGADRNAFILNARKQKIAARKVLEESFARWVRDEVLNGFLDEFFPTA